MPDLDKFKGVLPYATELRGLYQPLLGWESNGAWRRFGRETSALVGRLAMALARDSRLPTPPDGRPWSLESPLPPRVGGITDAVTALAAEAAMAAVGNAGGMSADQWASVLSPDALGGMVGRALDALPAASPDPAAGGVAGNGAVATAPSKDAMVRRYTATASVLSYMAKNQPVSLNALFFTQQADWQRQLSVMAQFDAFGDSKQEVLSPVGLLHIFRQYFYEFETFLGPSVGHVWLSPGGTVELVEVGVRRTLEEKTSEQSTETIAKSELSTTQQDELSEAVKQENADDIKFGASAQGGFNFIVAHGDASASFDLDESRKNSSESTHKATRQQTEKLSSEIRVNHKTTFRTVTETTDTSSRRYVLQNTTDQLVNYELRRKMRQVGVQLQHIGTQLCWQYYIDEPGKDLWISALVHVAKPADADPGQTPPEAPAPMPPQTVQATVPFTLKVVDNPENNKDAPGATYYDGYYSGPRSGTDYIRIENVQKFNYAPPQGMFLSRVDLVASPLVRVDPNKDAPQPFVPLKPEVLDKDQGIFQINVKEVNFRWQPYIPIPVELVYEETSASATSRQAEYDARQKQYQADKDRNERTAYVAAVRERIKLAGQIKTRSYDALREEERHAVFRRLLENIAVDAGSYEPHLLSELIRRLFDLDSMMYFVAPDWWRAKNRPVYEQELSPPDGPHALTGEDVVGWGGVQEQGRKKYLVTEESNPAPLGASLGWLLQLDGDNLRNSFLNAAWIKAVVPIRPGREDEALDWLSDHSVEGDKGLSTNYQWQEGEPEDYKGKTVREVLYLLAKKVAEEYEASRTVDQNVGALPTEVVFEHGFDPVAGGVRVDAKPFQVFDQWVEVLPTDQVVATVYKDK